jgi:hypothetical protein
MSVSGHLEENGRHVTCDKMSTSNQGWTKNTWTDRIGVRMSYGCIVTAEVSLGGLIASVEMLRGWSVGGQIVTAPQC